jgi:hypothetical protein
MRTSAWPIFPSSPTTRPSSSAPKALLRKSIRPAVSQPMIHGVTVVTAAKTG